MTINSICVCGAGTMGSGIAQAAAQSGIAVILYELNEAVLDKAKHSINENLQRLVEKGKMTAEEKEGVFRRFRFSNDIQTCQADLFIEAIIEKIDVKVALFNQLAEINHSDCIFASNTSSLSINENLQRLVEKGKMSSDEKEGVFRRFRFTNDIQTCQADLFIEAIIEKTDVKVALFNQLAEINHSDCIFASNTSSLSITAIAQQVQCPERVIGMHFFNPATIMKLVEVVKTEFTNEETTQAVVALAKQMNKTPVLCKDSPGFIVNRVARPFYIESLRLVEEAMTDIAQADRLLEASGFKMGPFKLMDLIGNDINYAVSCSVYDQLGEPERLKPSFIQEQKVKEGKLGKKSGEGYYEYDSPVPKK